jgi:hypothetical protein
MWFWLANEQLAKKEQKYFCSHHITLFQIVEFPHNNIGEVIVNHNMYQRSHETHCSSIISENNT